MKFQLSDSAICIGGPVQLTLQNIINYKIEPSTEILKIDTADYLLFPDSTTSYKIVGQTAFCGPLDSTTLTIHVIPSSFKIATSNNVLCSGDTVQLCAPTGFANYLWNTGDTTACINTNYAGNYDVVVTAANCSATSDNFSLNVANPQLVTVSVLGDTLTAYSGSSYQWFWNGNPVNGAISSTYIAYSSGAYFVQVTDSNGCSAKSSVINIVTDLNEIDPNSIQIYPNPLLNGNWQLVVFDNLIGVQARIFDESGRQVGRFKIESLHSEIPAQLASGVYYLSINTSLGTINRKLVKL